MKLHYGTLSSNSRRVRITANLLGIKLEEHAVDLREPAHRAELVRLNPNNKVPVLSDGDFVLWESIAIMQYLCDRTPGQTLYPSEPRARAEINRWLSWSQAHWLPAIGGVSWERVWRKFARGEGPDLEQVKRHEAAFHQFATVLESYIAERAKIALVGSRHVWLVGDAVSLADIAVATPLMVATLAQLPLPQYPHVAAWFAQLKATPAWAATEPPMLAQLEAQMIRVPASTPAHRTEA